MRLIDADALKYKNVAEVNGILTHILTAEEIDNAPTIIYCNQTSEGLPLMDLRPRPKGEWLQRWKEYECSQCGYFVIPTENWLPNFCLNCGADMRKGGAE